LAAWLELDPGRIIGRFVEYHSEPAASEGTKTDTSAPLTDLCPPPRALAGEPCSGTISCAALGGRLAHRSAEFLPLPPVTTGRRRLGQGCGVLALLDMRDLSPEELAASVDPPADELHRTIRRFRRAQADQYSLESILGDNILIQKVRAQISAAAVNRQTQSFAVCTVPGGRTLRGPFIIRQRAIRRRS
jgi:hypothetical protein